MQPIPIETASRRMKDILQIASFVFNQPGSNRQYIQNNVEISATAKSSFVNYMNSAIDYGWIDRVGTNRDITYIVTPEFRSEMSLHLVRNRNHDKNELIPYNDAFLRDYIPNKTSYLTPKQIQMLESKGQRPYTVNLRDESVQLAVRRFMTDISFNSSRLEGVRANYADTIAFLEDGIQAETMSSHDAVILRNHYNTIKMVIDGISFPSRPEDIGFSEYDIRVIHSQISDGLLKDRRGQGKIRSERLEINNSRYIPLSNYLVLQELFGLMLAKTAAIENPFEQAAFISIHMPYLQPFVDCNKRTSRIAANIAMLRSGHTPFSWADTPAEAYNESMIAVYEFNEIRPFTEVFSEAYVRSCDRFDIMMNSREPSRVEVIYAKEIAQAVRDHIVEGCLVHPPRNALPGHAHAFQQIVHEILEDIVDNEMVATPYRIPRNIVNEWRKTRENESTLPEPTS